jgi:GNAT superfamily N-acetyltransferase
MADDDTMGDGGRAGADVAVRQAREADHGAVSSFTAETWPDREATDYIPRVFPEWVDSDGPDQRTVVAETVEDGAVIGLCQGVVLSEYEAWAQGMRVHPEYRGTGISHALNDAVFSWAADRGATVCRNMVFSWNFDGVPLIFHQSPPHGT